RYCLCLMVPPPPISTLFPYTTLFRSKRASFFVIYDGDHPIEISLNYHLNDVLFSSISSFDIDYAKFGLGHIEIHKQLEWCLEHGDRKSTRLNSSHVKISYAVFCLKKK